MKIIKITLTLVLLLIVWMLIGYLAISFYKMELNPFYWSVSARAWYLFYVFIYAAFLPLLSSVINNEFK